MIEVFLIGEKYPITQRVNYHAPGSWDKGVQRDVIKDLSSQIIFNIIDEGECIDPEVVTKVDEELDRLGVLPSG